MLSKEQLQDAVKCIGFGKLDGSCSNCSMFSQCRPPIIAKTALELMEKNERLEYTIQGIMHSVDKWLDDEHGNMDEVNRAAQSREIALRSIEKLEDLIRDVKPALEYIRNLGVGVNEVPFGVCKFCGYLKTCEKDVKAPCHVDKAIEAIEGMV